MRSGLSIGVNSYLGALRKKRTLLLLVLGGLFSAAGVPAVAQTPAAASFRDGSHDMDFTVGRWRTDVTMIKDPFNKPDQVVHMSGTKVARPFWNGKALIEEIEADGPTGHWEGATVFLYDPASHQWSQNYADADSGRFDGTPEIGEYRNGNLEFYWQTSVGGRTYLERGVWKDITRNSHTYEISRSNDGGRSWHTSFLAHLTRLP